MKKLIVNISIKIIVAFVICTLVSLFLNAFAPTIDNDVAIGQLENSDSNFAFMQMWQWVKTLGHVAYSLTSIVCVTSVFIDIYKFYNSREKN